tara:strand:- start:162 stop:2120 length:1959 start_codon:yes stop_codon:yes gene_type:complete
MSRFGDNATGPSNLEISNISGVSSEINTLAPHATAISNLGPVATQIDNLGTTAAIADMADLSPQAVRDDMAALANVTSELGLLGTSAMADASTGYITALGTSTVGSTSQLTVDALGQLTSEISLLASNITTLQNSASNSPIQIGNLSDVTFANLQNGEALVYNSTSGEWENGTVSAGAVSTSNITEVSSATVTAAGEVIHYDGTSAWTVGQLNYSEIANRPTDLGDLTNNAGYLTSYTETNDLTAAVTWANVPDGNITASSVRQHFSNSTTVTFDDATGRFSIPQGVATTDDVTFNNVDVDGVLHLDHATPATGTSTITGPATMVLDPYTIGNETGLVEINGDLRVLGGTTTIDSTILTVSDQEIVVAQNASPSVSTWNNAGLTVYQNTSDDPYIRYTDNGTSDAWNLNRPTIIRGDGTTTGQVGAITLNCSANSHGITVKSAPHSDNANYDLVLPATITSAGGKVLAQNSGNTQLEFIDVLKPADIIDNLTSTSTTDVLSAAQGKALQDNKQAAITTSSGTINAQALTTQVGDHASGNVSVDVRKANTKYSTADLTAEPGASLVNMSGAALTLTLPSTLEAGDIITVYANPGTTGPVKIIQGSGGPNLRINGETADVANPTTTGVSVGDATMAVITMVGSSLAIISGSDLT